jgi:hypothetical protein
MLLTQTKVPPDTEKHNHKLFIIDHPSCNVFFDLGMENIIFEMDDEALFNPALWKDGPDISSRLSDMVNRLIASGKNIVFMRYQPDILRAMGGLAEEIQTKFGDVWLFITFFHNDHDTVFINRPIPPGEMPERKKELDRKAEWILALGQFPFVKMIEIKGGETLKLKTLQEMFTEYAPEC